MVQPLEGIRVLDFGVGIAAPLGAMFLADMGAEVIKIEATRGEQQRAGRAAGTDEAIDPTAPDAGSWISLNRGKKDLAIDVRKEPGRDIVLQLAKSADVIVHNFRPGVMERLGLGYGTVSNINPKIVYCSLFGYGETGPVAHRAGGDMWAQAMSGMVSLLGEPGGEPHMVPFTPADQAGGIMTAYAITMALFVRERTGIGQEVSLNLLNVAMYLQVSQLGSYLIDGQKQYKEGRGMAGQPPPFGPYRAKDGDVMTMFGTDPQWPEFCRVVGVDDLAGDPRFASDEERRKHRQELYPLLDEAFSKKTRSEWQLAFKEARMRCDSCLTYEELCAHPQVEANEMIVTSQHPVRGTTRMLGVPIGLKKTPGVPQHPAPLLGQHTREILLQLGYTSESIADLERQGVILSDRKGRES